MAATGFCPPPDARASIPPTEEDTTLRHRRIQGEVQDENAWLLKGVSRPRRALLQCARTCCALPTRSSMPAPKIPSEAARPRLFDPATVELFAQRQGPEGSSRALGWDTPSENSSSGRHFSPRSIGHLGFSGCSLWIDLEAGVAVALLTNRTWPDRAEPADSRGQAGFSRCRSRGALASLQLALSLAAPARREFSRSLRSFQIQSKIGDRRDANQFDDAGDGRRPSPVTPRKTRPPCFSN